MNSVKYLGLYGSLLCVVFFTSCSSSRKFGNRGEKYVHARVESKKDGRYTQQKNTSSPRVKEAEAPVVAAEKKNNFVPNKNTAETLKREEMVEDAKQYVGIPYKYAGKNPKEGFDCSGFANFVYNKFGFKTSGPSHELAIMGVYRDKSELKQGDLVFFGSENRISHVGMIVSNTGELVHFIHSSSSSGIKIDEINTSEYWSTRYLFGRDLLTDMITPRFSSSTAKNKY